MPVVVHAPEVCDGEPCPFHNPSDHSMIDWPTLIRFDRHNLVERICPHGVGHPDPDSQAFWDRVRPQFAAGIHGCDGCCARARSIDLHPAGKGNK